MRLVILPLLLCLAGCSQFKKVDPKVYVPPEPPREFRAAWVATVANIDWPSKPGLPAEQQRVEMLAILDKCVEMRLGAVVFQVRPACDAMYTSSLEPWSEYLTGKQGVAPEPFYDPLSDWVLEAHRRGLELHCWFNPYRARHSGAKSLNAPEHVSNTQPNIVRKFNGWEWLDPAEPAAREHTLNVILDVVRRYDIDGVHIDDYFYPYPDYLKNADFPDEPAWQAYQKSGGKLTRGDWRREQVNEMIRMIHFGIKREKPHVKFGISPFGIYRPGHPATVTAGFDQYEKLYADAKLWLNEGWCDYFTPQLYWKIDSPQPYRDLLLYWVVENIQRRHIWPGNAAHNVNGSKGWTVEEIIDQVNATREQQGATGNVFFSMKHFMSPSKGMAEALRDGPYRDHAITPASPWMDGPMPATPVMQAKVLREGLVEVTWAPAVDSDPVWQWALWAKSGNQWRFTVVPGSMRAVTIVPNEGEIIEVVSIAAVGKTANASKPVVVKIIGR